MLLLRLLGNANGANRYQSTGKSTAQAEPPYGTKAFQTDFALFGQVYLCP